MSVFVLGVVLVLADVARRCWRTLHGQALPPAAFGAPATPEGVPLRCC
jgi:hypothetical protein